MVRSAVVAVAASIALAIAPGLTPMAVAASGDGHIDLTDSTTVSGAGWTYTGGVFTVTGDVTITGTTTTNRVVVASGAVVNIRLNGVNIDVSATTNVCAFDVTGATVNLTLAGENTLKSGMNRAGLGAPSGSVLTINAATGTSDRLTAIGGPTGAGIGGGNGRNGGNITISGGTVTATGGNASAGIGGGFYGTGGNTTINGGTVTATGRSGGAGIGGGATGAGGNITISGGTVSAVGGEQGAGIGGGATGAGGTIVITGGNVTTTGGFTLYSYGGGAGIGGGGSGGGGSGSSGHITIASDATINATGGDGGDGDGGGDGGGGGAGIGSGGAFRNSVIGAVDGINVGSGSSVTVTGGTGDGGSRNGAGIGYGGGDSSVSGNGNAGQSVTPGTTVTYRTVTVTQATGGTIAPFPNPSATNVVSGANQTYIVTPSVGYKIVSVVVDGVDVGAVTSWTIPNITDNSRTITAVFEQVYGVSLSETGTYNFSGAAYDYAAQSPLTVTVTNTGSQPTGALSVALSGTNAAAFTLSATSITNITASGGTSTFTVTPVTGLGVGTYTATVTVSDGGVNGVTGSFGVSFKVGLGTQAALTINGLGTNYTYGDAAFTLSTGGGSGSGGVTYVSSDTAVASVTGNMVTIRQAGSFTITATKAADTSYAAQSVTSSSVKVVEATPGVSLTHNSAAAGSALVLTATVVKVDSGDVPQGQVRFLDGGSTLATVTLDSTGVATHTIDPLDAASHTYQVQYLGQTGKYTIASSGAVVYEAGKTDQAGLAITPPAGPLTYGDPAFALSPSGGSGSGGVTYAVPAGNSVVEVTPGGVVTIIGAGTVTVQATKAGDSIYNPATATLDITVDPRDISNVTVTVIGGQIYTGSQLQPVFAVTDGMIAINPGDYTNTYGTNINAGTGTGNITLTGQRNYTSTKTVTFNIAKATQLAPPAVLAGEPSPTEVTLVGVPGAQYSLNGTTWQSSPVFTGLAANTTYRLYVWLPGDSNHDPSPTAWVEARTAKATYRVIEHFGTWTGTGTATSRVDGDWLEFTHLTIDGTPIDTTQYTVSPGTVIELTRAYLATLPEGDHTVMAYYLDGVSDPIHLTIESESTGQGLSTPPPGQTNTGSHLPITGTTAPLTLLTGALLLIAAGTHLTRTRHKATETTS